MLGKFKMTALARILWFITACLFAVVVVYSFTDNQSAKNLSVNLLGVFAMLSIALQTFLYMDRSTRETVETILKASQDQVEKITKLLEELKITNVTLNAASNSLQVIADDVVAKQQIAPRLSVTFNDGQVLISLRAGEICEVPFWLHNLGKINAGSPSWRIFLPPQLEVVDKGGHRLATQGNKFRYPGCNMLEINLPSINATLQAPYTVKLRSPRTHVGLIEIPFNCSCNNAPTTPDGKLSINFIG